MVNAAIKNADIEAQRHGRKAACGRGVARAPAEDDQATPGIRRNLRKAGRKELARQERGEIEIISAYLAAADVGDGGESGHRRAARQVGATSVKDMGKGHGRAEESHAGRMDFGKASALVKAMLAGLMSAPVPLLWPRPRG